MVLKRRLLYIFILCIFFAVESRAQENNLPEPFMNYATEGLVYNTVFTYKEHSFSGLMVVKEEEGTYRIVLLSKLGPSIMDFSLTEKGLIWKKVPHGMERAVIRKIMEKDFSLILLKDLQDPVKIKKKKGRYKVKGTNTIQIKLTDDNKVRAAETRDAFFKTRASYFYINDDAIPDEICVTHRYIKMKIEMKLLER